jgi:hypothetical protein
MLPVDDEQGSGSPGRLWANELEGRELDAGFDTPVRT